MKKLPFVLALLLSTTIYAQKALVSNAALQSVTVFRNGVEMNHTAHLNLPKGSSEIVFNNVANALDEASIQIGSTDAVTIMSVRFANNYLKEETKSPAYLELEDRLKSAQNLLHKTVNKKEVEQNTLALLDENRKIGGSETGLTVAELSKLTEYYRSQQLALKNNLVAIEEEEAEQRKQVSKLQQQLKELSGNQSSAGGQLVLQVMNSRAGTQNFSISYMSANAGWTAYYDLRAARIGQPLKIMYKANVAQSTGVDWNQVKLTLSSGMPTQGGTAPSLSTWFLRYAQNHFYPKKAVRNNSYLQEVETGSLDQMRNDAPVAKAEMGHGSMESYVQESETQLSTTYDIALPYDIAANGKPHSVALLEKSHPVRYAYQAIPRLDKDAFLIAEMTNYESLNLLPGEANIIFEQKYVGKSFINTNTTSDTLKLSLGRDKKIIINRKQLSDKTSTKLIGSSKKQTFTYEINVRNTKSDAIDLLLQDQIPVATDQQMDIELLEADGAEWNKETGMLNWPLSLKPGETKKIRFSYSVKYPKEKVIRNL